MIEIMCLRESEKSLAESTEDSGAIRGPLFGGLSFVRREFVKKSL